MEIADSAFIFCEFNSLTLKYDKENIGIDYAININSNAFYSVYAQYIDVEVDINLEENTESVFAYSTISSVTLPYSLNKITPYMFQWCESLTEIKSTNSSLAINHLSENVTYIGNNAFDSCTALADLYISNSIKYIGEYAFSGWGSNAQTIYIDVYCPDEAWDTDWNSDISSNVNFEYKKILVLFAKDGGNGGSDSVEVSFGQAMPEATKPTKSGFDFKGYYSESNGKGIQYYDENMNSVADWDKQEPSILYAYWKANIYIRINFDSCGGEGGTVSLMARLNKEMPSAEAPRREGYTFQGYFQYPEGYGTMYYNAAMESAHEWDQDVETGTIYAHWVANTYTVILSDDVSIEVTYGEPMPAVDMELPTRKGCTFKGYFSEEDGQGKQYYSQDLYSVNNWDIASNNVILYPKFEGNAYPITVTIREDYPVITVMATYGQPMPKLNISHSCTDRIGYKFIGVGFTPMNLYYDNELKSIRNSDFTEEGYLDGWWQPNIHTVTVNQAGGFDGINSFTVEYGERPRSLPIPQKLGYSFDGYYTLPNGEGTKIYSGSSNDYSMPGYMYSSYKWDIDNDITLYANWIGNKYLITFDYQGGDGYIKTCKQTYGELVTTLSGSAPLRTGYLFQGYYSVPNGLGTKYFDAYMRGCTIWDIAENKTLYAYWTPMNSTVVLDKMGGINGDSYVTAKYDAEMPHAVAPTRDGYVFQGYFTAKDGKGTQYYTYNMNSSRKWDVTKSTIVLYAYWTPAPSATSIVIDNEVQDLTILSTECLAASNTNEDK